MKSIREVIIESLRKYGGSASLKQIYSYVLDNRTEVRLNAKDNRKSIRGVLSKMKKDKKIRVMGERSKAVYSLPS